MKTSSQLRVLRNRSFGLLWTAGLISITGTWLLSVALPIFIYKLTDSPAATATAVAVRVGTNLIAAPLAGAYVDRWDRKKVLIYANVLQAITLLPLLAVDSRSDLWIAYLVIAAQATFAVFVMPAEHALLPRLVDESDLPAANGLNALNNNIARLLGPALGALVAATLGLTGAVLLDSASFLLAAGLCALIAGAHRAESSAAESHLLREIGQGALAIRQSVVLQALFAVIAVTAIGEGIMGSLFAVFVVDALHGDVPQVGWLMSAQAVGGIIGGFACGYAARNFSPERLLTVGLFIFGVIDVIIFNYPRWFEAFSPVVVLFVLVGIPSAIMTAAAFTMLQTEVADGLRARVFSAILVVEALSSLIGATLAGTLTERFGVINVLTGQGAAYLLATFAFAWFLRRRPVAGLAAEPELAVTR
ncbi:MFS transporter [Rhizocola hellebori]|uniref:MFS transporter n=1 Tax=Rhizocola hellebori TaxID=1392758 RepID=A0A8J3VHJ9_9ACTN|nr:MFS transporter [Rhizocola hellebori]GIH06580.1 MFS transporter [Rhizocola hellebori]